MMANDKQTTIETLESALNRLMTKENSIFFLAYDTKTNARAAIKHIYDMALVLRLEGYNSKILVEDNTYSGVKSWLGSDYDIIPVISIKDNNAEIKIDDVVVVPEVYSNILPQLSNVKCIKVMLVQQKEYVFEALPIGSKWSTFGFDTCITTTKSTREYIQEYFPDAFIYQISPYIGDNFSPSNLPLKPYIAISCRDRSIQRKIISEFYLKFPQLRWITFRDMVQMSYYEFSDALKECMVSIWVDNESTFGTFPLESIKCGIPVVGKVPFSQPDWMDENGFWTHDIDKISELAGSYILANLEGIELKEDVKQKMKNTLLPYSKEIHKETTISVFHSLLTQRTSIIKANLEQIKSEQ